MTKCPDCIKKEETEVCECCKRTFRKRKLGQPFDPYNWQAIPCTSKPVPYMITSSNKSEGENFIKAMEERPYRGVRAR